MRRDGALCGLGSGEPDLHARHQRIEDPPVLRIPAMSLFAIGVERCDDRHVGLPEDEPRRQRHQRLVHVNDVEALGAQQLLHGPPRPRIDAESCFRVADDDRDAAAERDFAVRRGRRRRAEDADIVSEASERAGLGAQNRVHAAGAAQVVGRAYADAQGACLADAGRRLRLRRIARHERARDDARDDARARRRRSRKAGVNPGSIVRPYGASGASAVTSSRCARPRLWYGSDGIQ